MSAKKKPEPMAEETTPALETDEPLPELVNDVANHVLGAVGLPLLCGATKGGRSCTLSAGHAGYHHAVPSKGAIDSVASWA